MINHLNGTARFFDGEKTQPFVATLAITSSELMISFKERGEDKTLFWPAATLEIIEKPHDNRQAVIGSTKTIGARLILSDELQFKAIFPMVSKKNIKASQVNHSWYKLFILMLICVFFLLAVILGIPKAAPFFARLVPASWDDKLGHFVIRSVANHHQECVAPQGKRALAILVSRLTDGLALEKPLNVKVIDFGKGNINAFAVPGYHIVIMNDLLRFADHPDELAAILSHEMGHAILHHPTQGLIRRMGIQLMVSSITGIYPIDIATQFLHSKHSRNDEQAADDKAVELLTRANIDKKGLSQFFEKILALKKTSFFDESVMIYFSDHPAIEDRIKKIQSASPLEQPVPSLTTQEWQDLKSICREKKPL